MFGDIDMSKFNTANIENRSGSAPTFSQGLNVQGANITSLVTVTEYYTGASEPSSPANGAVWYDGTDTKQYVNGGWYTLTLSPEPAIYGDRGVFMGSSVNMDYITISSPGNATAFGDLSAAFFYSGATTNGSRGVMGGGVVSSSENTLEYWTFATPSNSTDFGDLTLARNYPVAMTNGPRGVWAGGFTGAYQNVMDYIAIDTAGNATDFGDLTTGRESAAAASNGTLGLIFGGSNGSALASIDKITIATTANATDFGGDLLSATRQISGAGNTDRSLVAGGLGNSNVIQYVTPSSPGNAIDFGDLTSGGGYVGGTANDTRAVFGASGSSNTLNYVTIATTGNATDFGDLTESKGSRFAASGD